MEIARASQTLADCFPAWLRDLIDGSQAVKGVHDYEDVPLS
jgi:hypothetical protein